MATYARHDRNHGQRHRKGNTDLKRQRNVWTYPVSVYERQRLYQWRGFIKQLMADLSNTLSQLQTMGIPRRNQFPSHPTDGRSKSQTEKAVSVGNPVISLIFFPPAWILLPHITPTRFTIKSEIGWTSLLPAIRKQKIQPRDLFFEHQTSCAILSDGLETSTCQRQTALGIDSPYHRSFWDTRSFRTISFKSKRIKNKWTRWAEQQHRLSFWIPSMDRTNQLLPVTISRSKRQRKN